MENGFQYLDILLYAAIAIFLIFRLGGVLGKRGGFRPDPRQTPKRPQQDEQGKTAPPSSPSVSDKVTPISAVGRQKPWASPKVPVDPVQAALAQIAQRDPSFDRDSFLQGAGKAFEMILEFYAACNVQGLQSLLSPQVFEGFATAVKERENAGQRMEDTLVALKKVDIIAASLQGDEASVTVKFVSEQINVLYDADGNVLEGDPKLPQEVVDNWTFTRSVASRDPNWFLSAAEGGPEDPEGD